MTSSQSEVKDLGSIFSEEQLASEKLRSNILILLFGSLTVLVAIIDFLFIGFFEYIPDVKPLGHLLLLFFFAVFVYELIIRIVINWALKRYKRISKWIRYGNALEEASIPTIAIIVFARLLDPIETILGPASFLYFVFIVLGALRLNFKISVVTGLVAALEYFLLYLYYLYTSASSVSIFTTFSIFPKCAILVLTGVITGVVTLEIKKRIRSYFYEMQLQNRLLEQKVKERTYELEALNENLQKRVEEAVKKSRENEQLLVQQSKMSAMGEMIGMIAHQWKQPLASIAAVVANMKVSLELGQMEPGGIDQCIDEINAQTHYLSDTITDFRRFLSPTKKKEVSNFGEIVENALKIIGKSLETKNIVIEKDFAFDCPIDIYPNELIQVIINLLKNAQDACLEKGIQEPRIFLEGNETDGYQRFSVKDNGGGIPEQILDRIFEPYFTTKGDLDGTGLGLYMSKIIVEKHCQGTLTAFNIENGACFEIKLPMLH